MSLNAIKFGLFFGFCGYLFTTKKWVTFLSSLSPAKGLGVQYSVFCCGMIFLQYVGLRISSINFNEIRHTIGSMLIVFAFFIIVTWQSCYINIVINGNCDDVDNIFMQSEDGFVYYILSKYIKNVQTLRIITYSIIPFILVLIGQQLIVRKISLS